MSKLHPENAKSTQKHVKSRSKKAKKSRKYILAEKLWKFEIILFHSFSKIIKAAKRFTWGSIISGMLSVKRMLKCNSIKLCLFERTKSTLYYKDEWQGFVEKQRFTEH